MRKRRVRVFISGLHIEMGVGCNFIIDRWLELVGTNQRMIKDNQLHMLPRILC